MTILEKVTALLGEGAVLEAGTDRVPRVAPGSPDAVALLLGTAHQEGWRVRIEGAGTWLQSDAPADLALTTRRLDRIPAIEPSDLTATAEAGIGLDQLRQQLADRGAWLAIDPPGLAGRTLGSVVSTATAGPLRHGFGPIKDHLLGVTFVTGDGRMVQSGGRVTPAALELVSPALARRERWVLAVRLAGSPALVAADEAGLGAASGGGRFSPLRAEEAHAFWMRLAEGFSVRPVTFRIGGVPAASDELLDLLQHQLGDEWISASPAAGAIRWTGDTNIDRLQRLRRTLAGLEVPLTLERAPWPLRGAVGHFGAYREGVGPLVAGLRRTFDPGGALVVATEGS